jgi:NADPH:quinone reductase-like Zn-dependent oxidoreductase
MKAVMLHGYGGPEQLVYEEAPDPKPGPGEVLVRVKATSVNPFDWKVRKGLMKDVLPIKFPFLLGSDIAGTVKEVGPGVDGFKVGDRVVGVAKAGSYGELAVAAATSLVALPAGLEETVAAALPVIGMTGAELVEQALEIAAGQRVLVTGALGGVGRIAVQTAAGDGAEVWAGVRAAQAKAAAALPVKGVLALDDAAAIKAAAGTFDAVADTLGGAIAAAALGLLKPGGRLATVAPPPPAVPAGLQVTAKPHFMSPDAKILGRLVTQLAEEKLSLPKIQQLPLQQAAEGHRLIESKKAEKVVLVVG